MALNEALKKLKFDSRLTEWYLKNNLLTQEELQKHLSELPDVANNVDISSDDDEEMVEEIGDEAH
ncbi:MAG: hypothetical protein L6Q37_10455 [Bdellovibrionaceae bacterium]|nr:hypothetical protein [Pseudobdellovibrionaceae bacterium]NUM58593.1 hypothetical protein [Pseudobdellovibrionaceae bacterium]